MPAGTWRITCPLCSYEHQTTGHITMVVRDDGTEALCPAPDERRIAEETTGKRWDELEAAGRIHVRPALVCLACGALDFYALVPSGRSLAEQSCRSCGQPRLVVLAEETGFFGALFERFLAPRCPICKEGRLQRFCLSPE